MISTVMRDRNFIIRGTTGETVLRLQMKGNTLRSYEELRTCTFSLIKILSYKDQTFRTFRFSHCKEK